MNKIYYLSSCDTCKRIIADLNLKEKEFVFQDIKTEKITEKQLEELHKFAGNYEALFSRIARKYKELGLAAKTLTEANYKQLILEEYTFLKRPVILTGNQIFIGNSKANIDKARTVIG